MVGMQLIGYTMAIERHDDGSASIAIHHGGLPMRLEMTADQAIATAAILSGGRVIPGGGAVLSSEPSGDNRPDGSIPRGRRGGIAGANGHISKR